MESHSTRDTVLLGLGLGYRSGYETDHPEKMKIKNKKEKSLDEDPGRLLRLGLSSEDDDRSNTKNGSLNGGSMSLSSSSVKKEGETEITDQRVTVNAGSSMEDEEGSPRKKLRLSKQQSVVLEDTFRENSTLNPNQKQALAEQLNLKPRQIEVWFQNRRARTKVKQTEEGYELLKKCCQTLTEENKRLRKELQELRTLKQTTPFYLQFPVANLSVCPSCFERLGGHGTSGAEDSPVGSTFADIGTKSQLHLHSFAAC